MYTAVHKGLRKRLFETAQRLQGCNFGDGEEREQALEHLDVTLRFLSEHAGHEDRFVQPRVIEANAQLAARVETAHRAVEQGERNLRDLMAGIASADAAVALERGPELCRAFNVLLSQHIAHMVDEETLVNGALWAAFDDDQLRSTQAELQASIPPARFGEWMHEVLPALNVQERIGMAMGIRAGAPKPAFDMFMAVGREAVGERWAPVEQALG